LKTSDSKKAVREGEWGKKAGGDFPKVCGGTGWKAVRGLPEEERSLSFLSLGRSPWIHVMTSSSGASYHTHREHLQNTAVVSTNFFLKEKRESCA
jgi:hypothetical protein